MGKISPQKLAAALVKRGRKVTIETFIETRFLLWSSRVPWKRPHIAFPLDDFLRIVQQALQEASFGDACSNPSGILPEVREGLREMGFSAKEVDAIQVPAGLDAEGQMRFCLQRLGGGEIVGRR